MNHKKMVTPVETPDTRTTQPFTMPDLAPIRAELFRRIDAAGDRNELDEGNATYADPWIASILEGWVQGARAESADRTRGASRLVAQNYGNLGESYPVLVTLMDEIAELENDELAFVSQLRGLEVEPVHAVRPDRPRVDIHLDLPVAAQLSGFELAGHDSVAALAGGAR